MVEWKGNIDRDRSGQKAYLLDSVEHFNVPNFFTLTRTEVEEFVGGRDSPAEILNMEVPSSLADRMRDAYKEIGMSSEVRNATGKARNLVGGQRENQPVSVRVSGEGKGDTKSRLNVGSSNMEDAFREVVASYYRKEREEPPAIIFQKMIEPETSGAVIPSYLDNYTLVETVQGLGISLERGITSPSTYLLRSGEVEQVKTPESQIKITKHPLNGGNKRKTVLVDSPPFSESEVKELVGKASDGDLGIKFAYKRGTFYVVDAFPSENSNPFSDTETDLEGIRASKGEISGVVGEGIKQVDETQPPESYQEAIIARKGGYTSTDAQKAREHGKPAIFFYTGEIEEGDSIEADEASVDPGVGGGRKQEYVSTGNGLSGTRIVSFNQYVPDAEPLTSYGDFFGFDGDKAVVDARNLDKQPMEEALEYLEFEEGVLVTRDISDLSTAIRAGFEEIVVPERQLQEFRDEASREERRFILEKLREL